MKVKDLIDLLKEDYHEDCEIAYDLWSCEDVIEAYAKMEEVDFGDAERVVTTAIAEEVLERVDHYKDAEIGINWDVIESHLQDVLDRHRIKWGCVSKN